MNRVGSILLATGLWLYFGNKAEAALFQDDFESNTTASAAAWPNGSGDFDPDAPTVGSWHIIEGLSPSDVQVSDYMGGTQPTNAHSGSNYLIAGYHHEVYGNWDHGGLAIANLTNSVNRARIDFWVWGGDGMHCQVDGKELGFADGSDAFSMVLTGSGEVKWNNATANATWATGVWNHVVVELDLGGDTADVTVNDQSSETFSATGAETLGSIRFRGDTTVYYDDILVELLPEPPAGILFQDDFDSATSANSAAFPGSGDFDPDAPSTGFWYIHEDAPEMAQVSSFTGSGQPTAAYSGSNYLIAGFHNQIYGNWDNRGWATANLAASTNRVRIGFQVWGHSDIIGIVEGKSSADAGGSSAFGLYLNAGGAVQFNAGGGLTSLSATMTDDAWNHIVIDLDLVNDTADVTVNSQATERFVATGAEELASVRFRDDNTGYYDDILVEPLPEPPEGILFQDDFDSATSVNSAAFPGSGDFDPDSPSAGSWYMLEDVPEGAQVSSFVGSGQPVAAHSGSNYLIAGHHYQVYGDWDHGGFATANLTMSTNRVRIGFQVWGHSDINGIIEGKASASAAGTTVFDLRFTSGGVVEFDAGAGLIPLIATLNDDAWNHIEIGLDLVTDTAYVIVNAQSPERVPAIADEILGSIRFRDDNTGYYDDIQVSPLVVLPTYADWLASYPALGSATNHMDDLDLDTMDNLLEYALGGNPVVDDAASLLPTGGNIDEDGGTNWMYYTYNRRLDAAVQGLSYAVVSGTNLVSDPLTNATEEVGSAPIDADFESVTNRISTGMETSQFMTLKVENLNDSLASRITPANPPNDGILFVDHSISNRSGHLGHALVEYEPGKILAFYPNCSADNGGHSAVGWMEFKRSVDGGETWSEPQVLQYSKDLFDSGGGKTAMAEKAVVTDTGDIVIFYLICDISGTALWQPYWTPLYSKSSDGGNTWSVPEPVCATRGRVYDAVYTNGEIRVLHFANDATSTWWGSETNHVFELHVSTDGGETFSKRSTLPFDSLNRGYGSLGFLEDGRMIAYVYNRTDEFTLDYMTSADGGTTWSEVGTSHLSRKIRNPQFIAFKGKYFMHGRSGAYGAGSGHMILYMSDDGITWDDGLYLRMQDAGNGAYSNSIIVHDGNRVRLLIQASHAYEDSKTNVLHWWLD